MPAENIIVVTTDDGSHTLKNLSLNETYHSTHGAIQESQHVFIQNGLLQRLRHPIKDLNILEVGFGTGLNVLLTALTPLEEGVSIRYTSLEPFPLEEIQWRQLNYGELTKSEALYQKIHETPFAKYYPITPFLSLLKLRNTLQEALLQSATYDLIYFDAFAPTRQPELWTIEVLSKVAGSMKEGAVFVTYCAKGQLKRDLTALGLQMETLPGAPGKKEMVRATKL